MKRFVVVGMIFLAVVLLFGASCSAQVTPEDYAPILYFESEETCYPIDADFQIDWSYLYEVGDSVPVSSNPSGSELALYTSNQYYYLDNQEGSPDSFDKIISDSQSYESANGNTVYYRTFTDSVTGTAVIQYWMFYAFNNGELNKHEGDWEMVEVAFEADQPSWVAYSQHHGGQYATWSQTEMEGNHIKVYVARGSHANYLRSYSGKLGIASDYVGSNGKVLQLGDYTLKNLDTQTWIDYNGRWGECGSDENKFSSAEVLGSNGPEGPKYREDGAMWDGVSWATAGTTVTPANDMMFLAEWFIYNFVLIMVLITFASLGLTFFLIYRRHKKYGLGPRIVSMLYIDGLNLKSIGNILCIVGIILAVVGLFNTWYAVSIDLSAASEYTGIQTSGMEDLIKIHGTEGVSMSIPTDAGFKPVATLAIPFSLFIGIGLVFLVIATIGISQSKKLGWKYIWRGVRIIIPVILIIIVVMALGSIIPSSGSGDAVDNTMTDVVKSISASPFGAQKTFYVEQGAFSVPIALSWGLGIGAQLLLVSGIIIIVAGILEMFASAQFFTTKAPEGKANRIMAQPAKEQPKSAGVFCTECGAKLKDDATFCTECGKKLK